MAELPHPESDPPVAQAAQTRLDATPAGLRRSVLSHLLFTLGRPIELASLNDFYQALAYTVRDFLLLQRAENIQLRARARRVAYLSAEFLTGPFLANNLLFLGIRDQVAAAVRELGLDLDVLLAQELEPGLGNGGLGRLAACLLDSLATQEVPAIGYGIRYEYGIFHQSIVDGAQVEDTDKWLRFGNPWEVHHPEWAVEVKLGGYTEHYLDDQGRFRVRWVPNKTVAGVPFDIPIAGYRVGTVNSLRLWRAEATEEFDFSVFNRGDYLGAVSKKVTSENLSKVLYPNDESEQGKELRLEQQYFFVSCSLQDMLRMQVYRGLPVTGLHESFAIQLNDTHPAVGIAELMRLLVDERLVPWEAAWETTRQAFSYTNHTLLPEALERWSLDLFRRVLPRHLEIIEEINRRFLNEARIHFFGNEEQVARMSIIGNSHGGSVNMAYLAAVGSHTINGVSELHTGLLQRDVLRDFYTMWPDRFVSITNGVTPRRWVALGNPRLGMLLDEVVGEGWRTDWERVADIEAYASDSHFRERWQQIKRANKADLARLVEQRTGVRVDPDSMFDVLVKRIHEYKRQHLLVLYIVTLYRRLKSGSLVPRVPRTFVFSGKAAPGYRQAKLLIELIHAVGQVINHDPDVRDSLKVVFLPNFNVSLAQRIYPAADLSEQISLAGKEASGTGNMKFAMNGALTIGTMDGANIEICDAVGPDAFFRFGMHAGEVHALHESGYDPRAWYEEHDELRATIDLIASGFFSRGTGDRFLPVIRELMETDRYMLLADYDSYVQVQGNVDGAYLEVTHWTEKSIRNCARSCRFSSDRTIREYCQRVWKVDPLPMPLHVDLQAGMN